MMTQEKNLTVTSEMQVELTKIECRIQLHMQGACESILEVGRCLIEVKERNLVPHGQWQEWLRGNTGMSERSAQRLMQTARQALPGTALARLPVTKIQAILALPEAEREGMAERAEDERMSLRELQTAVERERARADQSDEAAINAGKRAEMLEQQLSDVRGRIDELAEMKASRARKADDAVSPTAQREIDRLREELDVTQDILAKAKDELEVAEQMAQRQSERAKASERELLNYKMDQQRGGDGSNARMDTDAVSVAVACFMGSVGAMPHMPELFAALTSAERSDMSARVSQLAAWVQGMQYGLNHAMNVIEVE